MMSHNRSLIALLKKQPKSKKPSLNLTDEILQQLKNQNNDENLPVVFRGNIRGVINRTTQRIEVESSNKKTDVRTVFRLFDNNQVINAKRYHRCSIDDATFMTDSENWSDWTTEEKTSSSSHSKNI